MYEPFAGQAAFLVAAMRHLRELLPFEMPLHRRHEYFTENLSGTEIDPFALEVAFLSLMLADYPNPDGWNLKQGDVFLDSHAQDELASAHIVLCNPPFEDFTIEERRGVYQDIESPRKPAVILRRVLDAHPAM